MINNMTVQGYKSLLNSSELTTTNLNVLVGANASGKSSLLQMLLLLRQSLEEPGLVHRLHLSGPLYEAGTVQDVLHPSAEHKICFSFSANSNESSFLFTYNREKNNPNSTRLLESKFALALPWLLAGKGNAFAYLNAERIGPRVTYPLPPDDLQLAGLVGKHGEFTTALLARAKAESSVEGEEAATNSLAVTDICFIDLISQCMLHLDQIDAKDQIENAGDRLDLLCNIVLGWVIPGAVFSANENPQSDSAALRFVRDPAQTKTEVRATHIGFGLSYTLPIIAASLSLDKNGLLLVENPEAHLHPFSQSRIGAFLAIVAASGRQVFVETHSDHVVNGMRLVVSKKLLPASEIIINFCSKVSGEDRSEVTQIKLDESGALNKWPLGFFDQIENDLSRL